MCHRGLQRQRTSDFQLLKESSLCLSIIGRVAKGRDDLEEPRVRLDLSRQNWDELSDCSVSSDLRVSPIGSHALFLQSSFVLASLRLLVPQITANYCGSRGALPFVLSNPLPSTREHGDQQASLATKQNVGDGRQAMRLNTRSRWDSEALLVTVPGLSVAWRGVAPSVKSVL